MWRLALLLVCLPSLAWGQETVGLLKSTHGTVTLERQQQHQAATPGMSLVVGDVLRTGPPPSAAALVMVDDSRFVLGGNSRFVIRQYTFNATTQAGAGHTGLPTGTLAVQSGVLGKAGSGNTLTVTTPKATVRVQDAQVGVYAGKE